MISTSDLTHQGRADPLVIAFKARQTGCLEVRHTTGDETLTVGQFDDPAIANAFAALPEPARATLLTLREWIFEQAARDDRIGTIVEDLKWGQPSYATRPKSGVPLRLGQPKDGSSCALYVPCQSALLGEVRDHYDGVETLNLWFEGNRGLHFDPSLPLPEAQLRHAIQLALTYYNRRKGR
nr:DUF1801 domain-containing protein [uncultured Cohaesibacter sp.]